MRRLSIGLVRGTLASLALAALVAVAAPGTAWAGRVVSVDADVSVWVEGAWDVYPDYDDVVISLRAARSCYATLFVVDTWGYVHVVHPLSPRENAWVSGGVVYRFGACELGLDALAGRGIVHVFAVASPRPFDFARCGDGIFVGRYGFRVVGDPYIACRQLYATLLPGCDWGYARVGWARFYVREWARYPAYLCCGHVGARVRVGDACGACAGVYERYRAHTSDPEVILAPRAKFKSASSRTVRATDARERASMARVSQPVRRGVARKVNDGAGRVISTSRTVDRARARAAKSARGEVSLLARTARDGHTRSGSAAKKTRTAQEVRKHSATRTKTRSTKTRKGGGASGSSK
jgi:hypothetical protein